MKMEYQPSPPHAHKIEQKRSYKDFKGNLETRKRRLGIRHKTGRGLFAISRTAQWSAT
jgi:hypothetical protein